MLIVVSSSGSSRTLKCLYELWQIVFSSWRTLRSLLVLNQFVFFVEMCLMVVYLSSTITKQLIADNAKVRICLAPICLDSAGYGPSPVKTWAEPYSSYAYPRHGYVLTCIRFAIVLFFDRRRHEIRRLGLR